jgi:hypothetical protein
VLSINTSLAALDRMDWRPFSSVGQAISSLLGVKPDGKKEKSRGTGGGGREIGELDGEYYLIYSG